MSLLVFANVFAFIYGGYYELRPWIFIIGIILASVTSYWASLTLKTEELGILMAVTILTSFIDEYAHTQQEIFIYYDGLKPSPLTVFGWGLFITSILKISSILYKIWGHKLDIYPQYRMGPPVIGVLLLVLLAWDANYFPLFNSLLVVIYILMSISTLLYSHRTSLGWNFALIASSTVIGGTMEGMGAWEGMWSFYYGESISLFMIFTWHLRVCTILMMCNQLGFDYRYNL